MVSLFLSNLFAKVQKVFGFTSGKGVKFGLGQEKSPDTMAYQGCMKFLFVNLYIILPSQHRSSLKNQIFRKSHGAASHDQLRTHKTKALRRMILES